MPEAELVDRLREAMALAPAPALRLALLFGSFARGQARPGSDVDVAILPVDRELALADELALAARLSSAVRREVDLVRLDHCIPALRWRVANEGLVLFARSRAEEVRFRAAAGIEHAEYAPLLQRSAERFARRVAQVVDGDPPRSSNVDS